VSSPDWAVSVQALAAVPGVAVVTAAGEVDVAGAVPLREALVQAEELGASRIVLDLTDVGFLDSTGLGILVGTLRRLREVDGELYLVVTNLRLLRVLNVTHLDQVFEVSASVTQALELALASADR
jgi:anti-sigma B factor antagonist